MSLRIPAFTKETFPESAQWRASCWTGTVFCVLANYGNNALISTTTAKTGTWTSYDCSADSQGVWSAAGDNNVILAVGDQDFDTNCYVMRSMDSGQTWSKVQITTKPVYYGICKAGIDEAASYPRFIAVSAFGTGNAAIYSDNAGANWTSSPLSDTVDWKSIAYNGTTIIAAGVRSYSISTDNAVTWDTPVALTMPGGYETDTVQNIVALADGTFVIVFEYCLAVSTDNGANWTVTAVGNGRFDYGVATPSGLFIPSEFYGELNFTLDAVTVDSAPANFTFSTVTGTGGVESINSKDIYLMIGEYSTSYFRSEGFLDNVAFFAFSFG